MVATVGKIASASYYLGAQESMSRIHRYYSPGEEPDGVWYDPHDLLSEWRERRLSDIEAGKFAVREGGPGPRIRYDDLFEAFGVTEDSGLREAAEELVDGGRVDSIAFNRLYAGFSPIEYNRKVVANAGSARRAAGLDMTFSADKSVSALWAIGDAETRSEIEAAHAEAVRTALDEIVVPNCSYTRVRGGDRKIRIVPGRWLAATFQHGSSRDDDPQLHTHVAVFNLARDDEGRWRALYRGRPFFRWKMAAGAVYRMALAKNLQDRLGVGIERYGRDGAFTRVAGMSEDLEETWSKRRRQMLDAADRQGWSIAGNADRAASLNLVTRAAKNHYGGGSKGRFDRWVAEAREVVGDLGRLVASVVGRNPEPTPERVRELTGALEELPARLTRDEAVFLLPDVHERVANAAAGTLGVDAWKTAVERVLRDADIVELDRRERLADSDAGLSCSRIFSTRDTIRQENEVGEMAAGAAADGRFGLPRGDVEERVIALRHAGHALSAEQEDALRRATEAGRVTIIEGAAGSGKTTTLRPLVDLYRDAGYRLIGAAVPWRVAVALGTDCGIEPRSVAQLLKRAGTGRIELDDRTVIVVDEASMLSTRQMHRLLRLSEERGCKLVLCGDTEQQQAVEAGPGLRLVRDEAGSAVVRQIRRQLPDLEDALVQAEGLDEATARLEVALVAQGEAERRVTRYLDLPDGERPRFRPWQVAASEAFARQDAAAGIAAYRVRGRFHLGRDLEETLTALVDDWARWRAGAPGQSGVVMARTHREVEALTWMMRRRNLDAVADPKTAVIESCQGREDDRRARPLEIARGDLLRIGATQWEARLYNGSVVEVLDFEEVAGRDGDAHLLIDARDEYGRKVRFSTDDIRDWHGNVRIRHGYASTITSAQGMTVDRAFLLADDRPARETIYPAVTRHRRRLDVYVNREPIALDISERRPEDESGEPVTDDDVFGALAAAWSRSAPKAAAHDHMSPGLDRRIRAEDGDGAETAPAWLAANDNGGGALTAAGRAIRRAATDLRHGSAAAAIADGCAAAAEDIDLYRGRAAAEGRLVAVEDGFRGAVRQAGRVLAAARRYRRPHYGDLLARHGVTLADLRRLQTARNIAERLRRSVAAELGRVIPPTEADYRAGMTDTGPTLREIAELGPPAELRDAGVAETGESPFRDPAPAGRQAEADDRGNRRDDVVPRARAALKLDAELLEERNRMHDDRRGGGAILREHPDYGPWRERGEVMAGECEALLADPGGCGGLNQRLRSAGRRMRRWLRRDDGLAEPQAAADRRTDAPPDGAGRELPEDARRAAPPAVHAVFATFADDGKADWEKHLIDAYLDAAKRNDRERLAAIVAARMLVGEGARADARARAIGSMDREDGVAEIGRLLAAAHGRAADPAAAPEEVRARPSRGLGL